MPSWARHLDDRRADVEAARARASTRSIAVAEHRLHRRRTRPRRSAARPAYPARADRRSSRREQLLAAARPARRRCSRGRSAGEAWCSAGPPSRPRRTGSPARRASRSAHGADDHRIIAAELEQRRGRSARRRAGRPLGPSPSSRSPRPARSADRRPAPRRPRARPERAGRARPAHRRSRCNARRISCHHGVRRRAASSRSASRPPDRRRPAPARHSRPRPRPGS